MEKDVQIEMPDCTLQTNQVRAHFLQKLKEKEKVVTGLEQQVKELQSEIDDLNNQVKLSLAKNEKLSLEIATLEEEHEQEVKFLNDEVLHLKAEKEILQMHFYELRESLRLKRFNSTDIEFSFKDNNNYLASMSDSTTKKDPATSSPLASKTPPSFAASFSELRRLSTIHQDSFTPTDNLAFLLEDSAAELKAVNPKLFRQPSIFGTPPKGSRFFDDAVDSDPGHLRRRHSLARNVSVINEMPLSVEMRNFIPPTQESMDFEHHMVSHNAKLVEELMEARREVMELKIQVEALHKENEELRMVKKPSKKSKWCCIL